MPNILHVLYNRSDPDASDLLFSIDWKSRSDVVFEHYIMCSFDFLEHFFS